MTYAEVEWQARDEAWISRVRAGLVHTVANVKIKAAPVGATQIAQDALGRSVLADQEGWGVRFALPVAFGFMGAVALTEAAISDADIFARIDAIYDHFFAEPAA